MGFFRSFRRQMKRMAPSKGKHRKIHFEALEPRILLSTDPLSYTAAAGAAVDLTLRLEEIAGTDTLQLIDTGTQSVLQSQVLDETSVVEITGSDQEDTFRIDLDFDDLPDTLLLTFDGSGGTDALWGPDTDNTWRITDINEGTLNSRLSFKEIENLAGGSEQDTFIFDDGAGVDGMITGGLGFNTLDYQGYSTAVTIDLGTGAATGTDTAGFIHQFIGGTAQDTLVGASNANTWKITGADEGTVNDEIYFSGFENLTGPAGNEDAFVLTATGSISGMLAGGDAGYDSLLITLETGDVLLVVPDGSGAATADTDAFETTGRTINYAGLEPLVDQTDADNVVIHGTVLDDDLVLEDDDIDPAVTGKMRLDSLTYDFLLNDGTSTAGLAFDNPAASLAIDLKAGNDTLTLNTFDPDFSASLRVSGATGNDRLAGPDTINDWQITGSNAGILNNRVEFSDIENLTGGGDGDIFTLMAGGRLDGMLGGGAGDDGLIGPDSDTIWQITEAGDGELKDTASGERLVGFAGIENLTGSSANEDAFIFGPAGNLSGVIDAGADGYDSLLIQTAADGSVVVVPAVADNSTTEIRTYDGRTYNYRGLEPFVGTADPEEAIINGTVLDDALVLEDQNPDPAVTGSLQIRSLSYQFLLTDGSTTDRLAFANPATALTIDLKAGNDTFTLGVFDPDFNASLSVSGAAGTDTLTGPDAVGAWEITGRNQGTLNALISFAGFENLSGGSEVDTFTLLAGALLSGTLAGGAGNDELTGPETDSIWQITGAGAGVLTDMASGELLAEFVGMENLAGGADNEDAFVFGPGGRLSGTVAGGTGGYDSLVIQTGTDTVVIVPDATGAGIANYDSRTINYSEIEPFVDAFDPANIVVRGTVLDDRVVLEDADPAATGSMQIRSTDPSYRFFLSGSLSDRIAFTNPAASLTINLKAGSNSLTLGDFDPGFGASLLIQDLDTGEVQVARPIVLQGMDFAISAGTITLAPGVAISTRQISGDDQANDFSTGDSGSITFSGQTINIGSGAQLLAHVEDGSSHTAGNIHLIASNTAVTPLIQIGESSRNATITIGPSAVLKGGDILLSAEAGDEAPEETDSQAPAIFENFTIEALKTILTDNCSLPVAAMIKRADALVQVGEYARIIGSGDVIIEGSATADGSVKAISGGLNPFTLIPVVNFSVAYSEAEATAKALIGQGAVIAAGGNVTIDSKAEATANATARTSQNLGIGFTSRNSIAISVAVADSETTSHTTVSQGAVITAGGNVSIHSKGTNKNVASAETGTYDNGLAGMAVGLGFSDTDIQAVVSGTVMAGGMENSLDLVPGIAVIAALESSELSSAVSGQRGDPLVKDALLKGEIGPLMPWIMKGSLGTLREKAPQIKWDWPITLSGAIAYSHVDNDVIAKVGSTGVLKSNMDVKVDAVLSDKVQTVAESVIAAQSPDKPETPPSDGGDSGDTEKKEEAKDDAISVAVIVGLIENTALASIESGASIDASRDIAVTSKISYPFLTEPKDLYGPEDFASPTAIGTLLDQKLGIQSKLFNSWARSVGEGGDYFGIAGSVAYMDFTNDAEAIIRSGAQINQDQTYWSDEQSVSISVTTEMELVNLAGVFDINLQASTLEELQQKKDPLATLNPMGSSSEKGGFGGSAFLMFLDNTTIAKVEDGARIHTSAAGGLHLHAGATITNIALAQSGSDAGTFGISGTFSYIDHESLTLAQIESGAIITGGPVSILATDDTNHFNLVGGVMKGNNLGIGASVGINTIDRETYAGIGNVIGGPGELAATDMVISGDLTIEAHSKGDIKVFSLAAAIMTEKKVEKEDTDQSGDSSSAPLDGLETGDPLDGVSLPALFGDAAGTPTDEDDPENPGEKLKSEGQGKTGIGIAGDVSINTITDSAVAYINDKGKITADAVSLIGLNETDLIAASGSAAITTTGEKLSLGIAGAFSMNTLEGITKATIAGTTIETGELSLQAVRTGDLFALTAGGALAPEKKGIAIAGSVSLNRIENETAAYLENARVTVKRTTPLGGNIGLSALDNSEMLVIAGSLSYGGKIGVGASVALNKNYNTTKATIKGSALEHDGGLTLWAINDNEITSAAAGIAASKDTLGASGAVSLNFIDNEVEASILNSTNRADPNHTSGSISLLAKDDSLIQSLAGAVGAAKKIGFGGALAYNSIENTITAYIDDSELETSGSLNLSALSLGKIKTISAGAAGAQKLSLAGAVSLNFIESTIDAHISNSPHIDATGTINILAADSATISALSGSVAGAGKVAIGASVGYNDIANTITAYIVSSDVNSSGGNIFIKASESTEVTSIAAGGAGAGKVAIGGSVTINDVGNTTTAYISGNAAVEADGSVVVAAHNTMDMLLVAGVLGGAGTAAIGVSNTTVITDNTTKSYIGNAQVTAKGKQSAVDVAAAEKDVSGNRTTESLTGLAVTATSSEDIQSFAVAGQGAGKAAIAGSATVNVLTETTTAYIGPGATINGANDDAGSLQGVNVMAYDDTEILSVAGALSGAGTAGIGAGADVGVITKETQAYIWADTVNASGDVKVQANSTEDILSIAASLGGGGTAGIAGSAGVYVMDITTRAFIGDDPLDLVDLTAMTTTVTAEGSVLVSAFNDAEIDIIAGNIAGGGTAGIGVAAAVTVIDKTTEAFLGPNADVTGKGGGNGVTAHTGSFNDYFIDDTGSEDFAAVFAAAFMPGDVDSIFDTISFTADPGFKTGQAVIYSNGGNPSIGIEGGGTLEDGETYYVIAGDFDSNPSTFEIKLASTEEDAREGKAIDLADSTGLTGTHSLSDGIPSAPNAEVTAPGQQLDPAADTNFDGEGGSDLNPDTDTQTKQRVSAAGTKTVKGVAITAVNRDDIETIAASGGGAGTVAVNIGGSVNVISTNTSAYVAGGAQINRDTDTNDGTTSDQSVLVAAGNDLYHMGIAAAVSIAGTVSVTPGAEVTLVENNTAAFIGDGAVVKAEKDIEVAAHATEDFLTIGAGVGGGGTVGIGVAATVIKLDNTTHAHIGQSTGATANAGGNILVAATDTTETFMVAGSLGIGFGAAGIGGAAGITIIDKDTQAYIGNYSVVDAKGNGGYLANIVLDGTNPASGTAFGTEAQFRGLAVQAYSSEDIFSIGASAGGGLYVGLAGGVTVEIIDSDTKAYIGAYADINKETTAEHADQAVNVSAVNDLSVFALGGALGIGAVGIAGGVDVGIIRNDTTAYIGDNAEVYAQHDVDVNALSRKEIDSFGVSVGAGLAGISGSISVWSIGSGFNATYSYTEKDSDGNDGDTQSETPLNQSELTFVLSSESDKDNGKEGDPAGSFASNLVQYDATDQNGDDTTPDNTSLLGTSTGQAAIRINDSPSQNMISGNLSTPPGMEISGTTAYVGTGATVIAEDDVNIRAIDRLEFDVIVGSIALGGLGLGGSVAVLNVDSSVQAFISAETTVSAGSEATDDILVHAGSVEDLYGLAIAGQISAGLSLGAQVVIFNDNSTQDAFIGYPVVDEANSAVIEQAGGTVTVEAKADRSIEAEPYGGGLSLGGSIGVSVAIANAGGHTKAYIDDANIGQGTGTVGSVEVLAESVADVEAFCVSVSGGIFFGIGGAIALADYSPTIETSIRNEANITVAQDVTIESNSRADVETDAYGVSVGALGLGISVAISTNKPKMYTYIGNATVNAVNGSVTLRSVNNYDPTGAIRLNQGADANATTGAGGLFGAGGAYAEAETSAIVYTGISSGAIVNAGSDVSLLSLINNDAVSETTGIAAGLVGVGVSLSHATASGSVETSIGAATVLAGFDVDVKSDTYYAALADSTAVSGGVFGGTGATAEATIKPTISTYIGDGVNPATVIAIGDIAVISLSEAAAKADAEGVTVAGIGMGVSLADAEVSPMIATYVAPRVTLTAGNDISLISLHNYAADGKTPLAKGAHAEADSSGGSLLLSAAGSEGTAVSSAMVHTYVGQEATDTGFPTTIIAGGSFNLISKANNRAYAEGTGVLVSLGLAAGASFADAGNAGWNIAHFSGNSVTAEDVTIVAETLDYARAHTLAGAGALLATGVGAESNAVVNSVTKAYVGADPDIAVGPGSDIRAYNSFSLMADETPEALADSKGVSVGALGLSVGLSFSEAETRPTVRSFVGPGSTIVTGIFATGEPSLTFRSQARLAPSADTRLDFIPGIVTQVPHQVTIGGFWGFPATTITYYTDEIAGAQIARSQGSWLEDGFAPGQSIHIGGVTGNLGDYIIKEVSDSTLTLADGYQLVDENTVPSASIIMTADLTDTIKRDSGSWWDDGFRPGHAIRVSGTDHNDGVYRIESISADGTTLALDTDGALTNETEADTNLSVAPDVAMIGAPTLTFNTEAYFLGGANLTFEPDSINPDEGTITRDSGTWNLDGFIPGYTIKVYGSVDNDGEYEVLEVADKVLAVAIIERVDQGDQILDEENITPVIRQELPDTITRDSGNWTADGFGAGQRIRITNSLLNDGLYRIESISAAGRVLTLNADADGDGTVDDLNQLTNDAHDTGVMITALGEGFGGLAGDLAVIALQSLPLSGVSALADGSASSGSLLLSGAGTDNTALNNSSVWASVGTGTMLRFTGNADINAGTFATQRTTSDGVSVGALAGGASLAEANAVSDTQSFIEPFVSVTGGNLRIFAGGVDDSEAQAEVGTGGIIAGGDAEASTLTLSTAKAYLAPAAGGQPSPFNVRNLDIQVDHTARFDSVAVSTHAQLAGASLSEAVNLAASVVEASIGDGLVIRAEDITVEAINRIDKPLRKGDRANIRGASGGLVDLPLSNISYTEFQNNTLARVGDGAQLTTESGDREKPGQLLVSSYNDINVWDYVVLDSGGAVAIPVAFSLINGQGSRAEVEVGEGAALVSDGDIDLSSRTDAWLHSQTQISAYGLAGAGWGASGAILDADNRVSVEDRATFEAGRDIYLLAGTERMGNTNDIDLTAKTDIWNNTLFPLGPLGAAIASALPGPTARAETLMHEILSAAGLDVPAETRLTLDNQVTVAPGVYMEGVGDAWFYAEEGDIEVSGDGSAKDIYSELLGALTGGALAWTGGREVVDNVSGVQMDGSIEVGILNKQYLWLIEDPSATFDTYDSYAILEQQVPDPEVTYIPYTVQEESLLLNLVATLERTQQLRAQYDDYDPANVTPEEAAFDAEIARLESEIAAMGFSTVEIRDGVAQTVISKQNIARFIVVDPVLAQSGDIKVKGDHLIGSGSFKARGDTEIKIINETQYYLRTNDLIIPDEQGGRIWFNNLEVADPSDIAGRNLNLPGQAIMELTIEPGTMLGTTSQPAIHIENTKGSVTIGDTTLPAPDIELAGDLRNLNGSVTVTGRGGIVATGAIQAAVIDLSTEGKFILSYVDEMVSIGGDPKSAYSGVVNYYESLKIDKKDLVFPNNYIGTIYESWAEQQSAWQGQTGGFIFGDSVFISARYLNINGKIQSGRPEQDLILPASLDTTIAQLKAQYEGQLNSGLNPNPLLSLNPWLPRTNAGASSAIKAFFNYDEDRIELDPIRVQGGHIELVGEILSTGHGKIEIRNGYGDIDVENATSYDLLVQEVDVGSEAAGKLVITDLAESRLNAGEDLSGNPAALRTVFIGDGSSVQITDNSPTMAAPAAVTGAQTAEYDPVNGLRYEWVRGQAFTIIDEVTYRSSSWLGVDDLAKDPSNIYKTNTIFKDEDGDGQPDLVPLLQGEYTRVDTGNPSNYDYDFTQVTTDEKMQVGEEIEWSEKSGFWGLGRTYYTYVKYETGLKNFHRHSIKADHPIDIEFIGAAEGQVDIKSANNLLIDGAVKNADGATTLEAGWDPDPADGKAPNAGAEIRMTSDTARIISKDINLKARAGIGEDEALNVDVQAAGRVSAVSDAGDIRLVENSGDLTLGVVATGSSGLIDLEAYGSLLAYDNSSLVAGNKLELTARTGQIGDSGQWLRIDSGIAVDQAKNAGLEAMALGDIYIQETVGDLYLVRAEAVDIDGNLTGDVHLWASDGSIKDYLLTDELNQETFDELLALADEVGLRGSAAQARADANVDAFEATKEAEYHGYWGYRNQQRIIVTAADDLLLSFDAGSNTITRSVGTWAGEGFTADHQKLYISGSDSGNDGAYEVSLIDGNTIWLKTETPLAGEELGRSGGVAVIGEKPATLVTIELTAAQGDYLRNELGYDDDAIASYTTNLNDQYRYLDSIYGSEGDFEDPDWHYSATAQESAGLKRGAQWDDDALTFGISPALFKTTTTDITLEESNIKGINVDLRASEGVGAYQASLAVDLADGFAGLSDQQKVALAAAERDDVAYFGDDVARMSGSLTIDSATRTISRSAGSWIADGFTAGLKIWIEGAASNNSEKAFLVNAVSDTVITLADTETLEAETGPVTVAVGQFGPELDELTSATLSGEPELVFDAAAATITRDDGSWIADGFLAGKKIWVTGTAFNNGQAFMIEVLSDNVVTLAAGSQLQDETAAGARVGQIQVARMTIDQREDVDVEAPGDITIGAGAHVFLGSDIDLNLNQVTAGEQIILRSAEGIVNVAADGVTTIATIGPAGDLVLEAAENIGADLDANGTLVIRPILIDLHDDASLSARTDANVYVIESGDMNIADIYVPSGRVDLAATGSVYDGVEDELVNIESLSLLLTAGGSIGSVDNFLDIDQGALGGQVPEGQVKADAAGDIYLRDPVGNLNVDVIESIGGDVSLEAAVSIIDAAGDNNAADVIGRSISLNAVMGGIGLPFTGDLDVDTDASNAGVLTAYSGLNAYLFEVDEDLLLKQVGTGAGYTAFIQSPGRILNGNPDGANVVSGATRLYAVSGIGEQGNPLSTAVGKLEGYSETGEVWISNTGPLTVGGVSEMEGIIAEGALVITASSPVTVTETIQAADIIIEAVDDAEDGPGEMDDILVSDGVTLWSTEGKVSLRAGDNLVIDEGAIIQAATTVELFGDYNGVDPDPGIGATIDPAGQIIAESIWIFGGADEDVIDLQNLSVPATVSGGDGSDTLIGPDGDNVWQITGFNSGNLSNLNGTFPFTSVENLTSGNGNDTFYFHGAGSVSGIIDGGAGFDVLDFLQSDFIQEAAANSLLVDLPIEDQVVPFAATGGITRIEDILVILLAEVQEDGTLVLNMGPRAAERLAINTEDGNEVFTLSHVDGDPAATEGETIRVTAFGINLEYTGVRAIRGAGGQGDDTIILSHDIMAPAELDGGVGNDRLAGGAGTDVLSGGVGNDILEGGFGDDLMNGGTGDDRYIIVPGSLDQVVDVQGLDTLDFSGALLGVKVDLNKYWGQVQEVDEAGNQLLIRGIIENVFGSEFADRIYGNRFDNILEGGGGDDRLLGRCGDDTLDGGAGDDRLYGEWGDDLLAGGAGDDYIVGGWGEDLLFFPDAQTGVTVEITCWGNGWSTDGLGGIDILRWSIDGAIGTAYADTLIGDDSRTEFHGMGGDDLIDGRGGSDLLYGGAGDDEIYGGRGHDWIEGGAGNDDIDAGRDNDTVAWTEGDGNDVIDMDNGWDTLQVSTGDGNDSVTLEKLAKNIVQISGNGSSGWALAVTRGDIFEIDTGGGDDLVVIDDLRCTDVNEVVLYLGAGDDRVEGAEATKTIKAFGEAGSDWFIGGSGVDTFDGGEGSDWVDYSSAPKRVKVDLRYKAHQDGRGSKDYLHNIENIIATPFSDEIRGTDGANEIWALAGNDKVWARGGDDLVYGGEGNDKLWGGSGDDVLYGDAGDDRLYGDCGDDLLFGGADHDKLIGSHGDDVLRGGSGYDFLDGGHGDDRLFGDGDDDELVGGHGDDFLDGGQGDDDLDGGAGDDRLFGGEGDDKLIGAGGDDELHGDDGHDYLRGDSGDDRLFGGSGNDRIYGGSGADLLRGGSGDDVLSGDSGDDRLYGDEGDDILIGGSGHDFLDGGAGDDTLIYGPSYKKHDHHRGKKTSHHKGIYACASWASNFVNDRAIHDDILDPNSKIKITLPKTTKEKPGDGGKGRKR